MARRIWGWMLDRPAIGLDLALGVLRRLARGERNAASLAPERGERPAPPAPEPASPEEIARASGPRQVAALPWRRKNSGKVEIMLITSRDTGRWVLPKGWPEPGEALWDAAAREAREEAGLKGRMATDEAGRYHYDKLKASGEILHCEVAVFPLEVQAVAGKWPEKGQRKRAWVSAKEAAERVREPELSTLLKNFSGPARSLAA